MLNKTVSQLLPGIPVAFLTGGIVAYQIKTSNEKHDKEFAQQIARSDAQFARSDAQFARSDARMSEDRHAQNAQMSEDRRAISARLDAQNAQMSEDRLAISARLDAQNSRLDAQNSLFLTGSRRVYSSKRGIMLDLHPKS